MDRRNSNYRPKHDINSHSRQPRQHQNENNYYEDFDRYNYVDRDIYSNSKRNSQRSANRNSYQRSPKNRRRKKSSFKKAFLAVLSLLMIVSLAVIAYALIMFSRLDRSDTGNTASYVEQPSAAPAWSVISDNDITNILLIGIDKNDDGSDGRSDTNMLISIDNKTKAIHLVSFLRDTYLEIPTVGKTKLNSAFAHGGAALTMQTLENNYRINIDKYISVNSDNFASIINKMGGLDINMSKAACEAENRNMGSNLKPGVNHLNGKLALYYARIREIDSDFGRTGRQREVIELMIKKVKSMNPLEINKIMYDYLPYVKTNLSDSELLYLGSIAGSASKYPIKTMHVPNDGTYTEETLKNVGAVLVPNLKKNCKLLREFLYSEDESGSTVTSVN